MTKDDLLRMLWIAGVSRYDVAEQLVDYISGVTREECAELVENFAVDIDDEWVLGQAAKAIREKERT